MAGRSISSRRYVLSIFQNAILYGPLSHSFFFHQNFKVEYHRNDPYEASFSLIGLDAAPILLALAVWILRYPIATVCLINDGHQENPLETVKMLPEDASADNVNYYSSKHVSSDLA